MIDSTNPRVMADNIRHLTSDISTLQTSVEALGTYSTNETKTGEKFLGSDTYRKIFSIEAYPNNTTIYINHNITNLGIVLSLYGSAVDSEGSGITVEYRNTLYLRYTPTQIAIASTSDYSGYSGYIVIEYTKISVPSSLTSPAPDDDDTRSIESKEIQEVREEVPEIEEDPIAEVKKTN